MNEPAILVDTPRIEVGIGVPDRSVTPGHDHCQEPEGELQRELPAALVAPGDADVLRVVILPVQRVVVEEFRVLGAGREHREVQGLSVAII